MDQVPTIRRDKIRRNLLNLFFPFPFGLLLHMCSLLFSLSLRLPIFWLAFRNFPLFYAKYITNRNKEYVCLVFHPWEFVDIGNMDLPILIKRNTGEKLIKKLQCYINDYKTYGFTTISNYLLTS